MRYTMRQTQQPEMGGNNPAVCSVPRSAQVFRIVQFFFCFFFLLFLAVVVVADWTKPNIIFHGLVSSCPWTLEAVWIRWGQCENKTGTLQQRALTVMICNKTDGNRLLFIAKQLKVMSLFEMKKQMNITTPFLSFWPCDNTRTDPNQVALACYYCCRSKLGRSILIRNDSCDMYTL